MKQIQVVGIGLEGREGLSRNLQNIINYSDVLVGGERVLNYFPDHEGFKIILGDFLSSFSIISEHFNSEKSITILVTGDPLFFGLGRLLLEKFPADNLYFHPHISSVQLAFNRIKQPWNDAVFISVHGRNLDVLKDVLVKGVEKIAILTDGENDPNAIARFYLSLSLPVTYDFYICENLGSTQEKIIAITYEKLRILAESEVKFSSLNIVIMLRRKSIINTIDLPLIGLPDNAFYSFDDQPGLMTKKEIRVAILGQLALSPGQIIWDIGAGTGSVSIEIGRLCPTSQIYAIEKTAMGVSLIQKNCELLGATNVTPIHGQAPQILENLPLPHRVFIGGSSGNLETILHTCQDNLQPGGTIVIALATLEHQIICLDWLKTHRWRYGVTQIQITRSLPVGQYTRLSPLNPVTLVTANKP